MEYWNVAGVVYHCSSRGAMPVIYAGLLFVYGIGSTLRKALFE
jgi:hypothetical protein